MSTLGRRIAEDFGDNAIGRLGFWCAVAMVSLIVGRAAFAVEPNDGDLDAGTVPVVDEAPAPELGVPDLGVPDLEMPDLDALDLDALDLQLEDPFETVNRRIDTFNRYLHIWVTEPAYTAYTRNVPQPAREAIYRFFDNLRQPFHAANSALAGDWDASGHYLVRFSVNTIFGIAGTLEVAEEVGYPRRRGFSVGDLLCAYEVPEGPYVIVPFFGPSNLRSFGGRLADHLSVFALFGGDVYPWYMGGVVLNQYGGIREFDRFVEQGALDPYLAQRAAFYQHDALCGTVPGD